MSEINKHFVKSLRQKVLNGNVDDAIAIVKAFCIEVINTHSYSKKYSGAPHCEIQHLSPYSMEETQKAVQVLTLAGQHDHVDQYWICLRELHNKTLAAKNNPNR
ncbi:MAG: hypothetical protein CMF60_03365 [Magnetococcales bacterium]|nr:hypothetical protein [Magnetococcales bacterium]|tara:strand:+ start:20184 stop:20495 length:312 start_codon:yes stop_codon:yes gene_type:complete